MPTLPAELLPLIVEFAPLLTKPTWGRAKLLLLGALLARGKRTVTACLRIVGLSDEKHFQNYHRVLNRAVWSSLQAGRILIGLIVALLPADGVIVIGADDTIERRRGKKIKGIGCYRDAVRSSQQHIVKCFGLKWLSLMVLLKLPWSSRVWALPFLTVLCRAPEKKKPRKKAGRKQAKGAAAKGDDKTAIDRLMICARLVRRWLPRRLIVLVVDGGYAAVKLALLCASEPVQIALVMRMRRDIVLYHPPGAQPSNKRGRKPHKGARQRSLNQWAGRADCPWQQVEVSWYGGAQKKLQVLTRTGLWHTPGLPPVMLLAVLVRDPAGALKDTVFGCTKLDATPVEIIEWAVMRWSVEVTFEEVRAHLGVETQRQWSDKAIGRTTPVLFGLFSLVTLWAASLMEAQRLPINQAAWYEKPAATFSDCLTMIREHCWRNFFFRDSGKQAESILIPSETVNLLCSSLALAA